MKHVFKPLRNYLRGLNQEAFLSSIYNLAKHLEWNTLLPPHLTDANPYRKKQKIYLGFHLWSLDTLAREALLYSEQTGGNRQINWVVCAKALNLLREAEEKATLGIDDYSVFSELTRIAHRQFHWQITLGNDDLARYMRIYGQPGLREVIEAEYNLSIEQLFQGGFALFATFLAYESLTPAFAQNGSAALGFDIASLLDRFTTTIPDLKTLIMAEQSLDEDWAYTFNPLRTFPILKMPDGSRRCPIPGMLSRRFTDGMYFDVGKIPDALSRHLGPAYQRYLGEVLSAVNEGQFQITSEMPYGTAAKPKNTVDWIAEDEGGVLFIECKVLKLGKIARSKMAPAPETDAEFRKIAKAIGQTYQTLNDALSGDYPNWKPSRKPIYPIIVTMDDWNLFTQSVQDDVDRLVREEFSKRGINPSLMQSYPCKVCHIREFEHACQVMAVVGINPVMSGIHKDDRLGWQMTGYINTDFPEHVSQRAILFPQEHKKIMQRLPRGIR